MAKIISDIPHATRPSHQQQEGMAHYDDLGFFFAPQSPAPHSVPGYHGLAWVQQQSDGTLEVVRKPWQRSRSTLLCKVAHGRLSATLDGAIRLTLTFQKTESIDIPEAIVREAMEAALSLTNQL